MRRVFQHIVAVAVGTRHANNCGDELMQRTSAFCQAACCSFAAEAGAFSHCARQAAAARFASFRGVPPWIRSPRLN